MTLSEILKRAEKLTVDNSPVLLTAIGTVGTLTTAYLTGKASFKAAHILEDALEEKRIEIQHDKPRGIPSLDNKEKVRIVWKLYIPAASTGVVTVVSIIAANRIGMRRAAAVAAAYSISEKAFAEYKEKVLEKIGENKERDVRDDLAKDRVKDNPVSSSQVIITGGGDVLCYDAFTARYFKSDMESLKKAQNDLNYKVLNDFYASLSDFYDLIGLPTTSFSDEVGWNSDRLLELQFSTVLSDDGRPCISIDFRTVPIRDYYKVQ
jgi:hypothetical protein